MRLVVFGFQHPLACWRDLRAIRAYRQAHEWLRGETENTLDLATAQIRRAALTARLHEDEIEQSVHRWMETVPLDLLAAARTQGLMEFLIAAKNSGQRIGAVSDYPAQAKLTALGVRGLFDVVVCAQDAGVQVLKPEPAGILSALRQLGVAPDAAVYIGDRPEVDGEAARRAGVRFVWIGPEDSYQKVASAVRRR